jgi:lipoic acid synthetase
MSDFIASPAASTSPPPAVLPKPSWLKIKANTTPHFQALKQLAKQQQLATVCQEAHCPNQAECWSSGTATFMLMGDTCTRGCRFCNVASGNPKGWLNPHEPELLAEAVATMGWQYVVLTSVDRDDLPDGGSQHLASCIATLKATHPQVQVELLSPDFCGNLTHLEAVVHSGLDVFAHNVETVERLTPSVRDRRAGYQQSLDVLTQAKAMQPSLLTKTSLMVGLGETEAELLQAMRDIRATGVEILTLGQYLQPSVKHLPVQAYITPEVFEHWRHIAEQEIGFAYCFSGPLVRSSYKAAEAAAQAYLSKRI